MLVELVFDKLVNLVALAYSGDYSDSILSRKTELLSQLVVDLFLQLELGEYLLAEGYF
jgi:hypothetical protein